MPRTKSANDTQFAIHIPKAWLERFDQIVPHLDPTLTDAGVHVTRSDVMRVALYEGLKALEARTRKAKRPKE